MDAFHGPFARPRWGMVHNRRLRCHGYAEVMKVQIDVGTFAYRRCDGCDESPREGR